MAKVLLIAEHDGGVLNPSTAKSVACAASIPDAEIDVVDLEIDEYGLGKRKSAGPDRKGTGVQQR